MMSDDDAPLFTGAATEVPRAWPAWVQERLNEFGVFVSCERCSAVRYLTTNGSCVVVGAAHGRAWDFAEAHASCGLPVAGPSWSTREEM